ncbi:MAG: putative LPS assembly protein LptD [Candidatus Cloacimonadales bacterium]
MKYNLLNSYKQMITVALFLWIALLIHGQATNTISESNTTFSNDSLTLQDSLKTDIDTLLTTEEFGEYTQADSLQYSGKKSYYNLSEETISLAGDAKISYEDIYIEADSLNLSLADKKAYSTGDAMIKQGGQIFLSNDIKMNVESKTGILIDGAGSMEQGFIYGSQIRKVDDKVYDIADGIFTTCDDIDPHFYIKAKKLRIFLNDTIAGKPIVYYVNHFPVMALPFAAFSIESGRRNGFLIPQPGWNSSEGKYIKNIAYYYAYKDYYENKVAFDFYEKKGWNFNISNRYIVRYIFNGGVDFNFRKRDYNNNVSTDWSLRANHRHTLKNNASVIANINYATSKVIWDGNTNIDDRLTESVSSSATYSKGFDNSTFNVSSFYNENFITKTKTITLPTIRYSETTTPIYEVIGLTSADVRNSWWKSLSYNYNFTAAHYGVINDEDSSLSDLIWSNETYIDSLGNTHIINQHNAGAVHNLSFSFSPKLSQYFNVSQSMNIKEAWFDRTKEESGFARGNSYSFTSSASTKFYGLRRFNFSSLKAVRHVLTPNVSFNYTPDFSQNNDFYSFSGISLASGKRRRTVNFSLNQIWQIKYYDKVAESEKKINNLLSMNSSLNYDLEKKSNKMSTINHSLRFNPNAFSYKEVQFNYSNSISFNHDFYNRTWGNLKLENWRFNQALAISGNFRYFNYLPRPQNPLKSGQRTLKDTIRYAELDWDYYQTSSEKKNWSVNLSHAFSFKKDYLDPQSNNINFALDMHLTSNWHLGYSNRLNIITEELLSHKLSLRRDLHCWNLTFDYTKSNEFWEYKVILTNNKLSDILKFPFEARK